MRAAEMRATRLSESNSRRMTPRDENEDENEDEDGPGELKLGAPGEPQLAKGFEEHQRDAIREV